MSIYGAIKKALDETFIKTTKIAEILALAIMGGENVILYGKPGYGKSEMSRVGLKAALNFLDLPSDDLYIAALGQGTSDTQLKGGMDYAKMKDKGILEFYPERSFLAKSFVILEEGLDAPQKALNSLKNTLSAKRLEEGQQIFDMVTKTIVITTNKDPDTVIRTGDESAAFIERFAYKLRVEWPSHTTMDYANLFAKYIPSLPATPTFNDKDNTLASLLADVASSGTAPSPRVAKQALKTLQLNASLRGDKSIDDEDFMALCYIENLAASLSNFVQKIELTTVRKRAAEQLVLIRKNVDTLYNEMLKNKTSPIFILKTVKKLQDVLQNINNLSVTDDLSDSRSNLRLTITGLITLGQDLAIQSTRV